jgi:hypothetical protein
MVNNYHALFLLSYCILLQSKLECVNKQLTPVTLNLWLTHMITVCRDKMYAISVL